MEPVIRSGQDKVCIHTLAHLTPMKDSFPKEPYKRDDILQKRPIVLRSLLIVHANEGQGSIHTFAHTSTHSHTHIHTLSHTHTYTHFLSLIVTGSTANATPRNPPNHKTQIPWYKFKYDPNFDLSLHREIRRNSHLPIRLISGMHRLLEITGLFCRIQSLS